MFWDFRIGILEMKSVGVLDGSLVAERAGLENYHTIMDSARSRGD